MAYLHAVHPGSRVLADEDIDRINFLLKVLNADTPQYSREHIGTMVDSTILVLTRQISDDDGKPLIQPPGGVIVGMATLSRLPTLRGIKGYVEDMVVDPAHRGRGLGRGLMQTVMQLARFYGYKRVDLTSGTHRVEANKLYQAFGFVQHDTNVYRYTF